MSRNFVLQVLRGTYSQFLSVQGGVDPDTGLTTTPLAWGEMFFTIDTNALYFGTPGVGLGYIQIGDATQVNERLDQLIMINEAIRRALVAIACDGGRANPEDFDVSAISQELSLPSQTQT